MVYYLDRMLEVEINTIRTNDSLEPRRSPPGFHNFNLCLKGSLFLGELSSRERKV
jgi:hypothetical protein